MGQYIEGLEAKISRLEKNEAYLRVINRFAADLINIRTMHDLAWHVAREVVGNLGFVDCVIYLLGPNKRNLVQYAAIGDKVADGEDLKNKLTIPVGKGITGTVAATGEALIVGDLAGDDRYMVDLKPMQSEICVPLIFDGDILGVIDCEDTRRDYFQDFHLEILTTIATLTSAKICQCQATEKLDRMAKVMEQVHEAIAIVDRRGRFVDCNMAVKQVYGYDRDELIGTSFRNLVTGRNDQHILRKESFVAIREGREYRTELEIDCKNGSRKNVELSVSELATSSGDRPDYSIVVARDITERIIATEAAEVKSRELVMALKEAEDARRSQATFLANASHELRTPLNAVIGFSEMLKSYVDIKNNVDSAIEYATHIHDAGQHLNSIVNDLMSISTLDTGSVTPNSVKCDAGASISQCISIMEHKADEKSIHLDFTVTGQPVHVYFDPVHFKQIMINLIDNAIKYSSSGDPVSTMCQYTAGNGISVLVQDSGCGIASDYHELIFKPFTRDAEVVEKEIDGVGLGLTLSRRLARLNGADITVSSVPGEGSVFTLFIPECRVCSS